MVNYSLVIQQVYTSSQVGFEFVKFIVDALLEGYILVS